MSWVGANLMPILPEVWLLVASAGVLLSDLGVKDSQRERTHLLAIVSVLVTAALAVNGFGQPSLSLFSNTYIVDSMSTVLKIAMCMGVVLAFIYGRRYVALRGMFRGEWYALLMFSLLGMMAMVSGGNFVTLYVGLELLSLSLYALTALRRDHSVSTEAAMKYFVLGALASGMLLYGISMIYGATGSLDIGVVAEKAVSANPTLMVLGLVFIVAGIGFKFGNVPFHMWVPDVYDGSPTSVTLLIGGVAKIAVFGFAMRILVQALSAGFTEWQGMLIVLSVLSMVFGNLLAIAQTNLKRMLAYSTIAHMGFLLLGFIAGTPDGYSASMFYVLTYAFTSIAAFGLIMMMSRAGFEADQLDNLRGLAHRSPWFALMLLLVMFSMAGIPVMVGFFAKLVVIRSVVEIGLVWLAVVAVMASLLGAFFYLRVVKLAFMDEPKDPSPLVADDDAKWLLSINCSVLLFVGLMPESLLRLCADTILR